MHDALPLAVAVVYALGLFAFASWADGTGNPRVRRWLRPAAYALGPAVYCSSWTFYGAVGSAVTDGWSYLPIYLGPILMFLLGHRFLRRIVDAVKSDGANSISEFVGGRFGNSRGVAALVTVLALLGSIPYLALQLRSLGTAYGLITGAEGHVLAMAASAIGLALFAMTYGTRRYEASSRNDAVLFAVGFESLIKLGALLMAGLLALFLLAGADTPLTEKGISQLAGNFAPDRLGMDFFVITILSMTAIICLPRQFYITVIEAESAADIDRARWPFIGYMVATLLVILPIAAAGLAILPSTIAPDRFVLQLPLSLGMEPIALLIFLGGVSAATAMVLVEAIALATMVSNDLVAPLLLRSESLRGGGELGRALLTTRRIAIALIMLAAFGWAVETPVDQRLALIGLVAFAAMSQFAPVLILAVLGSNRDALAAKAGLVAGLLMWTWTLALPQVGGEAWLDLLAGTAVDPHALLGVDGLSPISHGTLWSLGANLAAFSIATARRVRADALPSLLRDTYSRPGTVSDIGGLRDHVARFVGPETAAEAFARWDPASRIERSHVRTAERMIASVVGLPSARAFIGSALHGSNLTHHEVARILDDTGQSLRFSKGLLAATLENIDPGVSVVDRDLNIVAWNSRYIDMFRYPPDMVRVGVPVADLIRYNAERGECGPGEVESHVERRLSHMRRGLPHSFERVRPDGRIIKTVGGPMPSGGYVMCFTDVTAEARALEALEKARAELEGRVKERTRALSAANEALAKADAEKTRFLAAASHDLLQPLHAARLFSAALGRDLQDAQRPLLDRLDRSIGSAEALLRALLDISRLDAGGVTAERQPVQVRPLLAELVDTMAPLARERGLHLSLGAGDAVVETDPGLLRSIVQNFLSNSIRYTARGGILVGVRRRGSQARIDVIDTGPGIPEDKREAIFREFERLPDAADGGVGLGLAIVDRTARVIGATISLESRLGHGSRFSVALPVATALRPVSASPVITSERADCSARLTILAVDDDPANRDALRGFLESLGHTVITATDADQALALNGPFAVALIDFDLGHSLNGLDLIQALRVAHPRTRYALVTAAAPGAWSARARSLGVPVLRKPIAIDALQAFLAGRTVPTTAA